MKKHLISKLSWALGIVIVLITGATVALLEYRSAERRGICINALRLIHHAKTVFAIKYCWTNGHIIADSPEEIWAILSQYADSAHHMYCLELPHRPHYNYNPVGVPPTCPYGRDHVYMPPDTDE